MAMAMVVVMMVVMILGRKTGNQAKHDCANAATTTQHGKHHAAARLVFSFGHEQGKVLSCVLIYRGQLNFAVLLHFISLGTIIL